MITSPTLLVDQEKVIRNIKRMQAKAEKSQAASNSRLNSYDRDSRWTLPIRQETRWAGCTKAS